MKRATPGDVLAASLCGSLCSNDWLGKQTVATIVPGATDYDIDVARGHLQDALRSRSWREVDRHVEAAYRALGSVNPASGEHCWPKGAHPIQRSRFFPRTRTRIAA